MKPYTRTASGRWLGTRQHGKGAISTPSSVLKRAPYAFGSNGRKRGTNPPELIAAAHAGSYAVTLAHELGAAGFRPSQIDTTATVTMEDFTAGWTMTQIHLDVIANVPKMAQGDFVDAALRAKANCPVSRTLNANISMRAELSSRGVEARLLPSRTSATSRLRTIQKSPPRRIRAKQ